MAKQQQNPKEYTYPLKFRNSIFWYLAILAYVYKEAIII